MRCKHCNGYQYGHEEFVCILAYDEEGICLESGVVDR